MPLRAIGCYSFLSTTEVAWDDAHFCVKKFVDAIKHRSIKAYAWMKVDSGPKRHLSQANASDAFKWFGEMATEILKNEGVSTKALFIPIPNSKCALGQVRSKTRDLADAIVKKFGGSVSDVLRFDEPQPSAHEEHGTRDPAEIIKHLRLQGSIPARRPIVLVDDVVTTGGHAIAAAEYLRKKGHEVVLVVAGACATHDASIPSFDRVFREL
jgi:predicted amidophosphoribosyltransferase